MKPGITNVVIAETLRPALITLCRALNQGLLADIIYCLAAGVVTQIKGLKT